MKLVNKEVHEKKRQKSRNKKKLSWVIVSVAVSVYIALNFGQILVNWRSLIFIILDYFGSSRPELFLGKDVLKICRKFTGEHPCRSVTSKKLLCNFTEITLRHGCSPVNLLRIFRSPFYKNTSVWLLLIIC